MNHHSDMGNNEILNRLRENIEKQENSVSETEMQNSKPTNSSPEDLLTELRAQMGTGEVDVAPREEEYDIRGFEFEEEIEENVLAEAPCENEPVISVGEPDSVAISEDPDDIPWEVPEAPADEKLAKEPTVFAEAHTDQELLLDMPEESTLDEEDPDEFVEDAEPQGQEVQEAVRKQIEAFVEKTIDPEEEFDYFAELKKKTEKQSDMPSEPESVEKAVASAETSDEKEPETEEKFTEPLTETEPEAVPTFAKASHESDNPSVTSFFFKRETASAESAVEDAQATKRLDDTDINLLLALGKKRELEETIGFVRVREAKNNFRDPSEDEVFENRAFAYNGEEFTSPDQIPAIKAGYRKEKKKLGQRFAGTVILAIMLLITEHIPLLGMNFPGMLSFLSSPINARFVNFLLLFGIIAISAKNVVEGLRGFLLMRPNRYSPIAVISVVVLIYSFFLSVALKNTQVISYNFVIAVYFTVSIVGDFIRLSRESMTFDIISTSGEKFSLEKAEVSSFSVREEANPQNRDLVVETVNFTGKYFKRTAYRSAYNTEYFIELLVSIIAAMFVAIVTASAEESVAYSINAFMFALVLSMPMQYLLGSLSFAKLSKLLYRHNSAIIGENIEREYMGTSTVFLDDIEVFGTNGASVSGLRTYGDANFYEILYYASAVFSKIEGPLRFVFEKSSHEIKPPKSVQIVNIFSNGIEASVDGEKKVLVGNINFMRSNGYFPKYNDEDQKKVNSGELCVLYLAVEDAVWAKFYMKYTFSKRFEPFVSEMQENHTKVGVRTMDPNITEKMIALMRKDPDETIAVLRPTLNDLIPMGKRSDSSIVTAKNSHMISKMLTYCSRLRHVNRTCVFLRITATVIGVALAILAAVFGWIPNIPSIAVALYQLAWLIPVGSYVKSKMK